MENLQDGRVVPSISMVVQGSRRLHYTAEQDLLQEYRLASEIPINEHMFVHVEMARLDVIDALRSTIERRETRMFPPGSGTLILPAQDPYVVNESYSMRAFIREPKSNEDRERLVIAIDEAQRRHHDL